MVQYHEYRVQLRTMQVVSALCVRLRFWVRDCTQPGLGNDLLLACWLVHAIC